jgi:lysozyme
LFVALVACGPQDPAELKTGVRRDGLQVCPGGPTVPGIDVSEWQGSIDWGAVAGSGLTFAISRINDGTHHDPYWDANWAGMKAAGLIRGAYQFYEPNDDPAWQANVAVGAVGQLGPGDLPVMLDVEWTSGTPTVDQLSTWLQIVEAGTGKKPMIYTALGYWNQYFNGEFGDYTLVVANYQVTCPNLPDSWGNWTFWQWGGDTVPGIGGNVDHDVFNGDLNALKQFAGASEPPHGYLDVADCSGVHGWAQDPKDPGAAIQVHVYLGGPAGSGAPGIPMTAGDERDDLCSVIGSCNHAYNLAPPYSLVDGQPHEIHAYGIDPAGGVNPELTNSPRTLQCAMPIPPGSIRRHVVSEASYGAWGFDAVMDLLHVSDADFAATPVGAAWPDSPRLVQGTGDTRVFLVDDGYKRYVTDPPSAASWHLDLSKVEQIDPELLRRMPDGPIITGRPLLIQASTTEIDIVDAPAPYRQVFEHPTHVEMMPELREPHASPVKTKQPGQAVDPAHPVQGGCSSAGGGALVLAALACLRRRRFRHG